MSRIDAIKKIVETSPNDPFPRYGLAMEYKNAGRVDEAHAEFVELERRFPDYVPQYLMHANVLQAMKRNPDARGVLERGLQAAAKKRDAHAQSEMQAALDALDGD
jgi:hypothetical protein